MTNAEFKAGPEGGGGGAGASKKSARVRARTVAERCAMVIPFGLNGYILYAFCYVVVWRRVRFHNRKAAIALLVIFCWVNLHLLVSWVAIYAWGPGRVTDDYVNNNDDDAPFICNEQGYSLYCSYCQRVKPNRAHHSRFTNGCVPIMDHFCPWVGTVIGQGNVKFFLQYCFSALAGTIIILVTLFVYQHRQVPHINGNSIALYVIAGFVFLFTGIMALSHSMYVMLAQTTLESIGTRKGTVPYINFLWRDGQRRVIQPERSDIRIPRPSQFSQGPWRNVRDIMGPVYTWTLPIRGPIREPQFNADFIELMRRRVDEKEASVSVKDSQ